MPGTVQNLSTGAVVSSQFRLQRGNLNIRLGGQRDPKCRVELWVDGVRTVVIPRLGPGGQVIDNGQPKFAAPYPNYGRLNSCSPQGTELMTWQSIPIPPEQVGKNACLVAIDENASGHMNVGEVVFSNISMPIFSATTTPLNFGWADLHTHPAAHLAFGGGNNDFKGAVWGRPGMAYPASDADLARDLPPCDGTSHGSADSFQIIATESGIFAFIDALVTVFTGGALPPGLLTIAGSANAALTGPEQVIAIRTKLLDSIDEEHRRGTPHGKGGYPDFNGWPTVHSVLHQQMHINWMKRAFDGGCRLIVASAVENELIAAGLNANVKALAVPDRNRDHDSAVTQVRFMRDWVLANPRWMKLCLEPDDIQSAFDSNQMAVVLGVEVDMLDDLAKVQDLYNLGVRHFTIIHLMDNALGGSATYKDLFNGNTMWANKMPFAVKEGKGVGVNFTLTPLDNAIKQILVGPAGDTTRDLPMAYNYGSFRGNINAKGITPTGFAVYDWLRKQGAIIDLSHMGWQAATDLLNRMDRVRDGANVGYPVVASHGGIRPGLDLDTNPVAADAKFDERSITKAQAAQIYRAGGLIGLGTNAKASSGFGEAMLGATNMINSTLGQPLRTKIPIALGSDINGLDGYVQPRNSFPKIKYVGGTGPASSFRDDQVPLQQCTTGHRSWNYNTDGSVHFGMFPDWLQDWFNDAILRNTEHELDNVMESADAYRKTWQRADRMKSIPYGR